MPISVASPARNAGLARALRALVRETLALERLEPGEIAIVLADDPALRALNRRYRSLNRTTDVLSFSYDDGAPRDGGQTPARGRASARDSGRRARPAATHGDVVISLDRVREQAARYRVTRGRELARLAVHGTLHLAGLDHRTEAERRHMRRREDLALRLCAAHVRALERALDRGSLPA